MGLPKKQKEALQRTGAVVAVFATVTHANLGYAVLKQEHVHMLNNPRTTIEQPMITENPEPRQPSRTQGAADATGIVRGVAKEIKKDKEKKDKVEEHKKQVLLYMLTKFF